MQIKHNTKRTFNTKEVMKRKNWTGRTQYQKGKYRRQYIEDDRKNEDLSKESGQEISKRLHDVCI